MTQKILVIDDEKEVCSALKDILSDEGYAVVTSLDPAKAIPLIQSESPDLVLLDVWFRKNMDEGLSTLQAIRLQRPYLPVIVISGHAASYTYTHAIRLGANAILEKPVNVHHLIFEMKRCITSQYLKILHDEHPPRPEWPFPLDKDRQALALSNDHVLLLGHDASALKRLGYAIHKKSHRHNHPCRSISAHQMNTMDDTILQGVEDMDTIQKTGIFDRLYGGTLVLTDIQDLNSTRQKDLLHLMKKQTFERISAQRPTHSNIRIIATAAKESIMKNTNPRLLNSFAAPFIDVPDICHSPKDFTIWIQTLAQEMLDQKGVPIPELSPENIEKIRKSPHSATIEAVQYALHALSDDAPLSLFIKHSLLGQDDTFVTPRDAFDQPWVRAKHLFEAAYLDFHMKRHSTISQMAKALHMNRTALHKKIKALHHTCPHTPLDQ